MGELRSCQGSPSPPTVSACNILAARSAPRGQRRVAEQLPLQKSKGVSESANDLRETLAIFPNAGIPPTHLRAYMLCGFKKWSWDDVWHRFKRMTEAGIEPFAMVYDKGQADLVAFQRWCNRRMYRISGCSWCDYRRRTKSEASLQSWRRIYQPR